VPFFKEDKVKTGNFSEPYRFTSKYKHSVNINVTGSALEEAKKNWKEKVSRNINKLKSVKNRAETMKYFDYLAENHNVREKELEKFKEQGGKIIGMFCLQVPEELIYAAGAIPIRLDCGFYDSISVAENVIPSNICPLAKSSFGFPYLKINRFFELCDAIVIPTTCDAKKKMAEIMSNYMRVWTLELPQNRDNVAAMDFWVGQVEIFKKKVERLTGTKITKLALEQAISLLHKRTVILRNFLEIKKAKQIVINGRDTLLAIQTAFHDDINRWMRNIYALTAELKKNISDGKIIMPEDTSRIMVTGSPMIWPGFKVLEAIEENQAVVVVDDSCAGTQYFYNTIETTDWSMRSMINAISDKYLMPTICPIYTHNDDRVDRVLELYEQHKADGLIYHILRLCQLIDLEFNKVNYAMKKNNIPMLKIETEYSDEDTGQIKTRVEAFIEMIKSRREQ